jgi:sugar phosphate isomerase/epimerase
MKLGISRIGSGVDGASEVIRSAQRCGFSGVQIKTDQLRAWDFSYASFSQSAGAAAPLGRGGIVFHPGTDYASWPGNTDRVLDFAKSARAEHVCYCFCPKPGGFDQAIDMLRKTGRRFADGGIPFSLHNHTGSIFAELPNLLRAGAALDRAVCGLTFDTAHAHSCGITDLAGAIQTLSHLINNIHLKDVAADGSFCPVGTGTLKLGEAITALKQIGYDQWLIVDEESRAFDTPTACDISIKFLRDLGL